MSSGSDWSARDLLTTQPCLQAQQHGISGAGTTAEVTWQDLPSCVAASIVRTALLDSGGGLVPWLRYSTVCRCSGSHLLVPK